MEEIDAYLDGDKVTCLVCGKSFVTLSPHINVAHQLTAEAYKQRYDIPWRRGLISRPLRERKAKMMKGYKEAGILPHAPSPEHIANLLRVCVKHRRPITQPARDTSGKRFLALHGKTERWSQKDFEEYLRRIKTGRTIKEVGKDPDMPCREVFDTYLRNNPAFAETFEREWNMLPFEVQVRAQRTGERFKHYIVELRLMGMTWPQIANFMNVKENTVRGCWHRLKHSESLDKYIKIK